MVFTELRAALPALFLLSSAGWGLPWGSAEDPLIAVRTKAPDALPADPSSIRVDSSLVLIPAHVTNYVGAIVSNLHKEDFQLTEDNLPQTITHFSMEDAPASIGLVFDCSGSMRNKMHRAAAAAEAFFRTANPQDEFFLVEVADRPKLAVPFSTEPAEIISRIERTKPFGRTALLDALQVAMTHMKRARNSRKALVILSDGGDNQSRRNARQIKAALLESDVQIYAMGLFDEDTSKKTSEERHGPDLLGNLTQETGGRVFPVTDLDELPAISERISNEVRTEYMLGYSPPVDRRDGKYHRVRVTVNSPGLHTYYRQGYYSPQ